MEDKVKAVRDLIAQRDEIDRQLAALFAGEAPSTRRPQRCSKCGQEGHTARTCTAQPTE
jgi:hypothetical protein